MTDEWSRSPLARRRRGSMVVGLRSFVAVDLVVSRMDDRRRSRLGDERESPATASGLRLAWFRALRTCRRGRCSVAPLATGPRRVLARDRAVVLRELCCRLPPWRLPAIGHVGAKSRDFRDSLDPFRRRARRSAFHRNRPQRARRTALISALAPRRSPGPRRDGGVGLRGSPTAVTGPTGARPDESLAAP